MITADLTRNPKQEEFFNTAIESAYGDNPYRYLFYGGAIRGGKTFACLLVLIILCKLFPGSKWMVIRKSFARIKETTLPSMIKILGKGSRVKWNRDSSNYYVEFLNTGSRIYFAGEDFAQDPELNWLLGFECNGFFLEQVEELQELTFDMCISRAGSWVIPEMPTPMILGTFNPTNMWVKGRIYIPYTENTLIAPYYYQDASPKDNPWVTAEQWKGWANMASQLYDRFIGGSWDAAKLPNSFAFAFDDRYHHRDVGYNSDHVLYASFDFNVEPITCLFAQHDMDWCHIIKEIRLLISDVWELTDHIITNFPGAFFMVTGDASGKNRTAITKGNKNYYQIIKQQLAIGTNQLRVPKANPSVRNTRVLCNSLLAKHGNYWINTKACPHLTLDLNGVVCDDHGDIDKAKDKRKTHLLDCWRYYNWTFHRDFIDKSLYQYAGNE